MKEITNRNDPLCCKGDNRKCILFNCFNELPFDEFPFDKFSVRRIFHSTKRFDVFAVGEISVCNIIKAPLFVCLFVCLLVRIVLK